MLDGSLAEKPSHYCDLPDVLTWGERQVVGDNDSDHYGPPPLLKSLGVGTRYYCKCGKTWIVYESPAGNNGRIAWTAERKWREESKRERRQRLELHWWLAILCPLIGHDWLELSDRDQCERCGDVRMVPRGEV